MNRPKRFAAALLALLVWAPTLRAQNRDIMTFDEVRVGMTGYGLTVFHGTRIEAFPVEVISTIRNSTPRRNTIWLRCPDKRMQKSGPVQGMSGSPIFLWDEGEEGEPGEGGRLIGAFAFGYGLTKDCIVGVQPIEFMRDIASRPRDISPQADRGSWQRVRVMLARLAVVAEQRGVPAHLTWRSQLLHEVTREARDVHAGPASSHHAGPESAKVRGHGRALSPQPGPSPLAQAPRGALDVGRAAQPLLLPLNVGSDELARLLAPLYEPLGIAPVGGDALAGPPPVGIDADAVRLQPGSVLAVPLVFGDADLAAAGTVTDVLDDGSVLGFGHAMFSEGVTALPMATGYVHFIVPSLDVSFKRTGSLRMVGSLVRDEQSGVLGVGERRFTTSPIDVTIKHPDGEREAFHYEMVNYRQLAAPLGATVVLRSILARQGVPIDCTMDFSAEMNFEGGRRFAFASTLAGADVTAPALEVLPILSLMTNNPFQPLELASMKVDVTIRRGVDAAQIVAAHINHAEVAPGGTVRVTIELQPQNAEPITLTGELTIPLDTPEGDYNLQIGGGAIYANMLNRTRPHRTVVHNLDDLTELIRETYSIPNEGLYLMLPLERGGVAVGRTELQRVPSSRAALLTSPSHTYATPFGRLVAASIDTPLTVLGSTGFQISVREGAYGAPQD